VIEYIKHAECELATISRALASSGCQCVAKHSFQVVIATGGGLNGGLPSRLIMRSAVQLLIFLVAIDGTWTLGAPEASQFLGGKGNAGGQPKSS